jgi:hypothetical protein
MRSRAAGYSGAGIKLSAGASRVSQQRPPGARERPDASIVVLVVVGVLERPEVVEVQRRHDSGSPERRPHQFVGELLITAPVGCRARSGSPSAPGAASARTSSVSV